MLLALVRRRWFQVAISLAVVGCVFPDLDDDDPVLYTQGFPNRDSHPSLGAAHGLDSVRTDTLSKRELPEPTQVREGRWPLPLDAVAPEPLELSPERPPPRSIA